MKQSRDRISSLIPAATVAILLGGCRQLTLFDPAGPIARSELTTIIIAFALMLIVVIPVTIMALWFPRRYRASAARPDYDPEWDDSRRIDLIVWLVPGIIIAALAVLVWQQSHKLDPFRSLAGAGKPLSVEVVSLDWKWLFIYPQQHIATINRLVLPAHVPISFRLTSASVLSSFFIPALGSQIYAMAGRQSRLHLLADKTGMYRGQNQQYSGRGFADMQFSVRVLDGNGFAAWAKRIRQSPERLDAARFADLSKPGVGYPVTAFSQVSPGLFEHILHRFGSDAPPAVTGTGGE